MAIAEIASQKNTIRDSNVSTSQVALPNNVLLNSMIVLAGGYWNATDDENVVVARNAGSSSATIGTVGYILSPIGSFWSGGTGHGYIAYAMVTGAGSLTLDVTYPNSGAYGVGCTDEFSGVNSTPLDVDGGEVSDAPPPTMDITTLVDNALIIGVSIFTGTADLAPGGGYTQIDEYEPNDIQPYAAEFRIVTTPTTYTVDWSNALPTNHSIICAAFKPSIGGGGPAPIPARRLQSAWRW